VSQTWIKELRAKAPGAPITLVGTKLDLRGVNGAGTKGKDDGAVTKRSGSGKSASGVDRGGARHVTTEEGEEMRRKIGAEAYVECSALTQVRSCLHRSPYDRVRVVNADP
jgi:Ras-related C3 botulinum toxin substrate 1